MIILRICMCNELQYTQNKVPVAYSTVNSLIGGSVVLFGKNRVLKLSVVAKLYSTILATKGQFIFAEIAQLTYLSHGNSLMLPSPQSGHGQGVHG